MRTVILCGGRGTRALPHTTDIPKPLMEVGGAPILGQVMAIYAEQGFTDFVLAAGFKGEQIADFAATLPSDWKVDVVDTGPDTGTGGRVQQVRERLEDVFFLTYGDGVGDVDLDALLRFHLGHGGAATLTTVPMPSQYGTVEAGDDGRVLGFAEKPQLADHRINAGFLVMDQEAFDHWGGDDLERQILPALSQAGQLFAYEHHGFWRSMDTYKDALDLTKLCDGPHRPWLRHPVG